jgi:hypothetical protein
VLADDEEEQRDEREDHLFNHRGTIPPAVRDGQETPREGRRNPMGKLTLLMILVLLSSSLRTVFTSGTGVNHVGRTSRRIGLL